jgi:hypothetical protein
LFRTEIAELAAVAIAVFPSVALFFIACSIGVRFSASLIVESTRSNPAAAILASNSSSDKTDGDSATATSTELSSRALVDGAWSFRGVGVTSALNPNMLCREGPNRKLEGDKTMLDRFATEENVADLKFGVTVD